MTTPNHNRQKLSNKSSKRLNRVQIEWKHVLTGNEYSLIDKLLFHSTLTDANEGKGFFFHVRTLSRDLNMSPKTIIKLFKQWPFIHKEGTNNNMTIQFLYNPFMEWIVQEMNNDCVPFDTITAKIMSDDCFPLVNDCFPLVNDCGKTETMIVVKGKPRSIKEEVSLESKLERGCSVVIQPANADRKSVV